ncbi:MAG TPA: sigma-70 family RNA polymerase sigma factor [Vicinamibacterales bacterium]|nr:sigma-70 family RNA polymerase sigma factor [Vicinamibacterales bacterium]
MHHGDSTAAGWAPWAVGMTRPEAPVSMTAPTEDLRAAADEVLVREFLAGRREAFDVIVERHRRSIYQLCYRFAGNHEDAADLAQDTFVRAFRGLKNFKGQSSLATWLYRIGVNVSLNRAASRKPASEPIDAAQHVDAEAVSPLDAIVRGEHAARVRAAIRQLPPKQRATLILRVYHELPHEEIARTLGSTVGAVKANFFHALGNLRRLMTP